MSLLSGVVALIPLLIGAMSEQERFEFAKGVMGVEARLVVIASSEAAARDAAVAAYERLDVLDATMSDYRVDSELARVNQGSGCGAVPVSEDLFRVLERAKEIAIASGGAFDVTVGPLTALWREAKVTGSDPSGVALADARARVGDQQMVLNAVESSVELLRPRMRLDLGGIGKGFAADEAARVLRDHGVEAFLIDLGGDVLLGSAPPGQEGWRVDYGRNQPFVLHGVGIATSGDREQFIRLGVGDSGDGGRRSSHILDPREALRQGSGEQSLGPMGGLIGAPEVTVIAPDLATADALASAASVLGRHEGRRLVMSFPDTWVAFKDPRFEPLFDGETLDGFVTTGGRYDGHARWSVEDGNVTGRVGDDGAGGLLYSAATYTDFVLELETRIDEPFESGVFLRMTPTRRGAQVTLDVRPGGEVGAVCSDEFLQHNDAGRQQFRAGQWNHVEVECTGPELRVRAWLNGELITDFPGVPQGGEFAPTGRIGLQVQGDPGATGERAARFRNLFVRPLPQ